MEVLWNLDGEIMESLWKFHGENPRLECGETVEHLWKNRYGETMENQHAGKLQTGKYQRRATME
jgi:hypothetical protein